MQHAHEGSASTRERSCRHSSSASWLGPTRPATHWPPAASVTTDRQLRQDQGMHGLHALVVDDEQPVLDELVFLLGRDERIASVRAARSGTEALRVLEAGDVDLVFLDVVMPGLSGIELGRVLTRF